MTKKETFDPHAVIQQYQLEIAQLKSQIAQQKAESEKEAIAGGMGGAGSIGLGSSRGKRRVSKIEENVVQVQKSRIEMLQGLILKADTPPSRDEDGPVSISFF